MVITYLQIQGILHPLYQLQEVPGLEPKVLVLILKVLVDLITPLKIVNGYNFAFCTDRALLPPLSHNPNSLLHLLEVIDYFFLYWKCLAQSAIMSSREAT